MRHIYFRAGYIANNLSPRRNVLFSVEKYAIDESAGLKNAIYFGRHNGVILRPLRRIKSVRNKADGRQKSELSSISSRTRHARTSG